MANIEERVVGMRFDSSKLTSGLKPAIDGLDRLKDSLKFTGAKKGLEEVDAAGKKFSLAPIGDAAQGVGLKFIALATIGITALSNIVNKAVDAGQRIIKSLTIDPVKAGFDEYELKMGSIQTILANTARFNTGLPEVVAALDELNKYADKTIYNFGAMTKNIGLFTNAGIGIKDATSMIKGFSNAAAASGVTAEGSAGAAYQLSQALSAGTIRLMDWRSLTNVGMGNKNMQNGLIEIADAMGMLSKNSTNATEIQGNFNASLEKNWLSADVMSNYLKIMAGDMTAAEQASLGLTDAQIEGFNKQQKTAEEAATKVRTYTQLIGTMQEAVGSGWTDSFDTIIGDFDEATELWTNVNNTLGDMVSAASDARNKVLHDWKDDGGRTVAIEAIARAFKSLLAIIKPVTDAFTEVFPPITGLQLSRLTDMINQFTMKLVPTQKTLTNLKSTAKGFFAVLDIGFMIVKGAVKMIWELLGVASQGSGGFLEFTGSIGDWLVKVRDAIKSGEGISKFFGGLGSVLKVILGVLGFVGAAIGDLFGSLGEISKSGFGAWIERVQDRMSGLTSSFNFIQNGLENMKRVATAVYNFFGPLSTLIGGFFSKMSKAIGDSFSNGVYNNALDAINTGLLGGIGVLIWKFVKQIKETLKKISPGGGIVDSIKNVFGELGNTLKALQGQIKAKALLTIAAAVGILTLSVIGLSLIDSGKLAISLGAITVMFGQLAGIMAIMNKSGLFSTKDSAKLVILSVAMIGMASAMVIFAGAVAIMSLLSWEQLARGLVGMALGMGIMVGAMLLLSKTGPMALVGAAAMTVAAVGIAILAGALTLMATLSWDEIGRSMTVLGASLAILAIGLTLMVASLPGAAALVIASVGILLIATALKIFATLSWDDIGRAMVLLGGTLAILAIGLTLMAASIPGAAALVIASVGLLVIAGVLKVFATLNWDDVGRAMVLLGGTLGILAIGLTLMIAALPGAAALVIAAGALAILAPVMLLMGSLSWEQIGTGLAAMALTLGLIAIAGYALIPAIPGLIGLGIAVAFLGVGVLAAGLGILALSIGLTALSVAGGAAITVLIAAVSGLAGLIPFVAKQIGLGIIAIAVVIGDSGPQILGALTTILLALVGAIIEIIPPLVEAGVLLITELVAALVLLIPLLVDAGMKIIIGILDGVAKNIGKVIEKGADVIKAFLDGLAKELPGIIDSAANLVVKFVNGIADAVKKYSADFTNAGSKLFRAIIDGVSRAIEQGGSDLRYAGKKIGDALLQGAKNALGIKSPSKEFKLVGKYSIQGLANGLTQFSKISENAATDLGEDTLTALKKSMANAGDLMAQGGMDSSPTIRPVLDLSGIKKDAGLIGGIVGNQSLAVSGPSARASEIAGKYGEYQQAKDDSGTPTTEVNMTQNNYSPKALPATEIYRQSKNQMSILKGELEKNA